MTHKTYYEHGPKRPTVADVAHECAERHTLGAIGERLTAISEDLRQMAGWLPADTRLSMHLDLAASHAQHALERAAERLKAVEPDNDPK